MNEVSIKNKDEMNQLYSDIEKLFTTSILYDVEIIVGKKEEKFKLHKNVLACRSLYFRNLFKDENKNSFNFEDINSTDFQIIITYLYTGK
jgi:hypothetical protein